MTNFYVKAGGDGSAITTNPATSGDWSSAAPNIQDVIDNVSPALAPGDFIYVSDGHSEGHTADIRWWAEGGASNPNPITVVSVDDNDTGVYKAGAEFTNTFDFVFDDVGHWYGCVFDLTLTASRFRFNDGGKHMLVDCHLKYRAADHSIQFTGGNRGSSALLLGCTFEAIGVTADQVFGENSHEGYMEMHGCQTVGSFDTVGKDHEGNALMNACDFSSVGANLYENYGNSLNSDEPAHILFKNCKIPVGVTPFEEVMDQYGQVFAMWNCDDGTGDSNHRFFVRKNGGDAENEESVVRSASQPFINGVLLSVKVTTTADCRDHAPFVLDFLSRFASVGAAAQDTAIIYLTSDTALTDKDIQARIIYPDAAIKSQANVVANAPQITGKKFATDPLAAATALAATSGLWLNPKTNQYKIELDMSADPGAANANVAPQIDIRITKPSAVIYFDSQVDFA